MADVKYMNISVYSENKEEVNLVLFPELGLSLHKGKKGLFELLLAWLVQEFDADFVAVYFPSYKLERLTALFLEVCLWHFSLTQRFQAK